MKIGLIVSTNDAETVWNAFRLANFSLKRNDTVKAFLLGKGVEAEKVATDNFNTVEEMKAFVASGGQIYACGTCLTVRDSKGSELCPLSTMKDLYEIMAESDKVLTF